MPILDPLDPHQTPLLDALGACARKPHAAFYSPGHKRGQGISDRLIRRLGDRPFQLDLPELPELGTGFPPDGPLRHAQQLAAAAFGASQTWFLANGSTTGVIASILATCGPGDKIILPRTSHRSAIAGLILSGAMPIFITPPYDPVYDFCYGLTSDAVAAALDIHPDVQAVMVVYPTYQGVCGDLGAIARLTQERNIPLLVDEAHGAHFAFHAELPPSALSLGADLVVQSTHKTLGAFSQSAMLHWGGTRLDPDRISQAVAMIQSSSPNHLLLASLDAARHQMAVQGDVLWSQALALTDWVGDRLAQMSNTVIFKPRFQLSPTGTPPEATSRTTSDNSVGTTSDLTSGNPSSNPSDHSSATPWLLDRTRLTLNVAPLGLSGFEVDTQLHENLGVTAELPTLHAITFVITFGNTLQDMEKLLQAWKTLTQTSLHPSTPQPLSILDPDLSIFEAAIAPLPALSPRDAFYAPTETVPVNDAIGQPSAELICPYPPGIPVLMPGEVITVEALESLRQVQTLGHLVHLDGCSDPTLQHLKVIPTN